METKKRGQEIQGRLSFLLLLDFLEVVGRLSIGTIFHVVSRFIFAISFLKDTAAKQNFWAAG